MDSKSRLIQRIDALAADLAGETASELRDCIAQLREAADPSTNPGSHPARISDCNPVLQDRQSTLNQINAYLNDAGDYAQLLVETSLDMIIAVDLALRIVAFNRAAEQAFGYSRDEVIGKSIEILYADPTSAWPVRMKTFADRYSGVVRNRRKNGETFFSQLASAPVKNDRGEVIGVMGISRDVSDQVRMEDTIRLQVAALEDLNQSLKLAQRVAEESNTAKSEFLANVSHEIRTPMTAILGYAEIIADGVAPSESVEAAGVIVRNGGYLLQIINDILDLSKIEAGKLVVASAPFLIEETLDEITALMEPRAREKGLTLSHEIDPQTPSILVTDEIRLRQILINLLGNAIKFTDQGWVRLHVSYIPGSHEGTAAGERDDSRSSQVHGSNGQLQISVADSGIGIPSEEVPKLFQPFVQVDGTVTRRHGGTGLGLALTRKLAQLLDGDVSVVSEAGRGTTFVVSVGARPPFPAELDNLVNSRMRIDTRPLTRQRPQPGDGTDAGRPLLGLRVLLVEDGIDNQKLISRILTGAGAELQVVSNGKEAVECVAENERLRRPFDLILMDMQMPVMDGYTASRELRQRGYLRPIVALTAHAMATDLDRCMAAGCSAFVSKPVSRNDLVSAVQAAISRSHKLIAPKDCPTTKSRPLAEIHPGGPHP